MSLSLIFPNRVSAATVGTVVPILGQPADLAYDGTRKLLFITNFTDNRIEVYSSEEKQLKASIPVGRGPVGIGLVPESSLLLICNSGESFLTLIDLNTLSTAGTIPVTPRSSQVETPFSVAVVSANEALLSTSVGFQLVDIAARTTQPITNPGFSSSNSRLVPAGNRESVYGQSGSLAFRYNALAAPGTLRFPEVRRVSGSTALAADSTGSRFMIGATQLNSQLTQTAQIFPSIATGQPPPVGGIAFSNDGSRVYVGINQSPAEIQIRWNDGLKRISSFRVPEPITGRMLLSPSGELLFAISESGITVVDLNSVQTMPSLSVSRRSLYFAASLCDLAPITQTVEITNSGAGTFSWAASSPSASVELDRASGAGPATLRVTVDPVRFRFRGTALLGVITISSEESISGDQTVLLLLNLHSPDQVGRMFPVDGILSDVLVDDARQRVYLANTSENQIEVFSISQNAFLPPIDVGSMPKSIALDPEGRRLWIGRLGSEFLRILDADSLSTVTEIPIPRPRDPSAALPGTLPFSIAHGAQGTALVAAAPAGGAQAGTIYRVNPSASLFEDRVAAFSDLAGTSNAVSAVTVLRRTANGEFIMGVQSRGVAHLYNIATGNFIISRSLGVPIAGNVAASADGTWFHAGDRMLSSVLVPQDPIPPTNEGTGSSVTGFAFAPLGSSGYRGIRPALLSSGVLSTIAPQIEKVDPSTRRVLSDFSIADTLVSNSTVPAFAVLHQLAVNGTETVLYGITGAGLVVIPLPNLESFRPQVNAGGIVNAASFAPAPAPVAAGSIASIFGTGLSTGTSNAASLPLPIVLGGICVTFEGVPAPIISTSPTQLNVQVPWELTGLSGASVVVSGTGLGSRPRTVSLAANAPGVFSFSSDGQGPGAILRSDFSPVSLANPARIGETILIYATGLGATSPLPRTGFPAPLGGPPHVSARPTVEVGGVSAPVEFSGLAPGFVGLYQINIRIPSNAPIGTNVPVVVRMGTRSSNQTSMAIIPASP